MKYDREKYQKAAEQWMLISSSMPVPRASELAELGQLAEQFGIRGVWVSSLLDSRDPFVNLVVLAQSTEKILLGPVAVNPYDIHPVRIASSFLTLNELAGGRARLVIGGGGEALEALGIQPERRVRVVRECVEIIKAAAAGESVQYSGELFQASNLCLSWLEAPTPADLYRRQHGTDAADGRQNSGRHYDE